MAAWRFGNEALVRKMAYRHKTHAGFPRVTSKTPYGRVRRPRVRARRVDAGILTDLPARIRLPRPAQGPPIYEPSSLLLVLW